MQHIVFVDTTHPSGYDFTTLEQKALGGTETSLLRTAKILTKNYFVSIYQKNGNRLKQKNIQFFNHLNYFNKDKPFTFIVLRNFKTLKKLQSIYTNSHFFLWIHTYKNTEYAFKKILLHPKKFSVVTNSATHAKHTENILNKSLPGRFINLFKGKSSVYFCYNPVPKPSLNTVPRNKNKLLFLSAPNKGLTQVLNSFYWLYEKKPELQLFIADPGYRNSQIIPKHPGIQLLGSISHQQVMQELASSLCLYYPQTVFAETFGLIYAEANAAGTPVLAHNIGSAREILDSENPLIDANNYPQILATLESWQKNLPLVNYNNYFAENHIAKQWQKLLDQSDSISESKSIDNELIQ